MSRGEATRQRILEATATLLASQPGRVPAMADVAAAAGVTRQLLYVHFDNRTSLLVELSRLIDARARTPQLQATIDTAPDAVEALRAAVRVQAAIKPILHGVAASLELLRTVDDGAATACQEREDARLARCRAVVDRLAHEGRLDDEWTPKAAAELLWSMTSLRSWEDLVHRAGWTSTDWTRHTIATLEAALLKSSRQPRPRPLHTVAAVQPLDH
jgi:AcrR family transcriptional regulator